MNKLVQWLKRIRTQNPTPVVDLQFWKLGKRIAFPPGIITYIDPLQYLNPPEVYDFTWLQALLVQAALQNHPAQLVWGHPQVRRWLAQHAGCHDDPLLVRSGICLNYWPGDNTLQYYQQMVVLSSKSPFSRHAYWQSRHHPKGDRKKMLKHIGKLHSDPNIDHRTLEDWHLGHCMYLMTKNLPKEAITFPIDAELLQPNPDVKHDLLYLADQILNQRPGRFFGETLKQQGWQLGFAYLNEKNTRPDIAAGLKRCHFLHRPDPKAENHYCIIPWSPQLLLVLTNSDLRKLTAEPTGDVDIGVSNHDSRSGLSRQSHSGSTTQI